MTCILSLRSRYSLKDYFRQLGATSHSYLSFAYRLSCSDLEPQLQRELPIARISGACNPPEIGGERIRSRIVKVRMVPRVKHLGADLESATLRNLEVLDGREVPSGPTITANPTEAQR